MTDVTRRNHERIADGVLNLTGLVLAILALKSAAPVVFQSTQFLIAAQRFDTWRQSMQDPRPGPYISLDKITPITQSGERGSPRRHTGTLLCMVSGCGT